MQITITNQDGVIESTYEGEDCPEAFAWENIYSDYDFMSVTAEAFADGNDCDHVVRL
jgi:hypothetical protein